MADINYSNFTLGIEEEYMVIDPNSRELKSHEQRIVIEGQKMIKDKVKAEMHQAVVEVGTDICRDISEARKDISTLRKTISQIANRHRPSRRRIRHPPLQPLGKPAHHRPCPL